VRAPSEEPPPEPQGEAVVRHRVLTQEAHVRSITLRGVEMTLAWEDWPVHALFLESSSPEGDAVVRDIYAQDCR